jgi:hypothetical protein
MRRLYQTLVLIALARHTICKRERRIEYSDRSGTDGTASLYPFWGIRKAGPRCQKSR